MLLFGVAVLEDELSRMFPLMILLLVVIEWLMVVTVGLMVVILVILLGILVGFDTSLIHVALETNLSTGSMPAVAASQSPALVAIDCRFVSV